MRFHIDAAAAESHALGFKAHALFQGIFSRQFDLPTSAEHALPGQFEAATKRRSDLPGRTRKPGSARDPAVG